MNEAERQLQFARNHTRDALFELAQKKELTEELSEAALVHAYRALNAIDRGVCGLVGAAKRRVNAALDELVVAIFVDAASNKQTDYMQVVKEVREVILEIPDAADVPF